MQHARQQIGEQERRPDPVAEECERRRDRDADADAGQKIDVFQENGLPVIGVRYKRSMPAQPRRLPFITITATIVQIAWRKSLGAIMSYTSKPTR